MKLVEMYSICVACVLYVSMSVVCSSENTTDSASLNNTEAVFELPDYLKGKDEILFTCPIISFQSPEYEIKPDRSVHIKQHDKALNESLYFLINDTISVCNIFPSDAHVETEHSSLSGYLTAAGLIVSMIGLFLHLLVFALVPDLRNLPGWNLATLCVSLFISYFLLLLNGTVADYPDACVAFASVTHFFLLASFFWMFIMSYDVCLSLMRATGSLRMTSTQFSRRKFGVYCLCVFGIAVLVTILSLLADTLEIVPPRFRPNFKKSCWFSQKIPLLIFFAGPVIVLSCVNFLLFGVSAYIIHFNKMKSGKDAQNSVLKGRYSMYFRLSVIMGVTWIVGVAANIADNYWVWCLFILLNTLQGFFIFLAFTCTKKVKKHLNQKILGVRRSSQQTLTPTFQSYCFYANSIEKDMDKIVDCKEKVETIMIHL